MTRPGAPPRQHGFGHTSGALDFSSSVAGAADQELVFQTLYPKPPPQQPCRVRLPPVPRMTANRMRRPMPGLKMVPASTSSITAKELLERRRANCTEVIEARYTRDLVGKQSSFWRSSLDKDILDQDFEVASMADYRQAAASYYQQINRDKAISWREVEARKRGLSEIQWNLEHGLMEICQKPAGDDNDHRPVQDSLEDSFPPAPRSSPSNLKSIIRNSLMPPNARGKKKRRNSNVTINESLDGVEGGVVIEGYESSGSEHGSGSHDERKSVGILRQSTLRPKQPRRVRLQRLKANARQHRQAKHQSSAQAFVPNSPQPPPALLGEGVSLGNLRRGITRGVSFQGLVSETSSEEGDEEEADDSNHTKLKRFAEKSSVQHRASQIAAFLQWNENDQKNLIRAFERYDTNRSDSLDQSELADCLADLGLRGKNEEERVEIRQILWSIDKLEVSFYEFATRIVPTIRQRLAELQEARFSLAFTEADKDGSGALSIQETLQQLRLMGTFPSEEQVKDAICQVCPLAMHTGMTVDGAWLLQRDILDFHSFVALVRLLNEMTDRAHAEQTRQLAYEFNLPEEDKESWQHNLVDMHQVFQRLSTPKVRPQVVSKAGASLVVRECGLAPKNPAQRMLISTVVGEEADEEGNIDFKALLRIREKLREHDTQWLHRIFYKHDCNRSGGLSLMEVHSAMQEMGIQPRTEHESLELRALIDEFDEDCSGEVDREEFVNLFRFVCEKLHKVQREVERQTAVLYGWSDKHFDDLREIFMNLDQDASETLEVHEMMQAIENLQTSHLREDINPVMQEAGLPQDSEGIKVDFLSFMKIMKALEDREAQRVVAKKYGYEGAENVSRLRAAFKELSPNQEGYVSKENVKSLLADGEANDKYSKAYADLQKELMSCHPSKVDFEVFVRFMKKKMELGVLRRNSVCVAD